MRSLDYDDNDGNEGGGKGLKVRAGINEDGTEKSKKRSRIRKHRMVPGLNEGSPLASGGKRK